MTVPALGNVQYASQSGGADNVILNVATGISNDDVILFIIGSRNTNPEGRTFNVPAGVTEICDYRDNNADAAVWVGYRIVNGSEASTYEFDWNGARSAMHGWCIAVSGNHATDPLDILGVEFADSTGTSHAITGATTTVDDCLALYALAADGGNMSPFSVDASWTEEDDVTIGNASTGCSACWGSQDIATAGATGTATVTSDASDGTIGVVFAIAPVAGSGDNLLADNIESASEVDSPAVGQTHALQVNDVESASEVDSPAVGQSHALLINDVESASEVSTPAISQAVALLADDVESASEVDSPAVGQTHAMQANDVESASEVDSPAVGQSHALLINDIESASEVSVPVLAELSGHALLADDVESASEVDSPAVGQTHVMQVNDVESASEVDSPAVGQSHGLLVDDVESASEVSIPIVGQLHAFLSDDVSAATEVSSAAINQTHALLADDVESASEVSTPSLVHLGAHVLLAENVESASQVILTGFQRPTALGYFPAPVPMQASQELRAYLDDELANIAYLLNKLDGN